jgi:myo-inositol-1(or 4)-monophosphatase
MLALAEAVARAAGAQLREAFRGPGVDISAKSTPTDLVSEADRAAERLIRERLLAERPGDAILGEEGGDAAGTTGVRWIVDPLDGTTNFLFGIPQWCVSVACEDGDGALAGAVYDPMHDELWAAERDGPATLNGRPFRSPGRADLATALIATGFGYDAGARAAQADVVRRVLPSVRDIRRAGSAALDLVWTAAGRVDAYYEWGVQPWDLAAGELICRRAGLEVGRLEPVGETTGDGIIVAPPGLLEPLRALLP